MREIAAPRFARGGFTNPFGKISAKALRNIRLPMAVQEELERQAAEIRIPVHEFVRELVTVRVMGTDRVKATFAKRIEAIDGSVSEKSAEE